MSIRAASSDSDSLAGSWPWVHVFLVYDIRWSVALYPGTGTACLVPVVPVVPSAISHQPMIYIIIIILYSLNFPYLKSSMALSISVETENCCICLERLPIHVSQFQLGPKTPAEVPYFLKYVEKS